MIEETSAKIIPENDSPRSPTDRPYPRGPWEWPSPDRGETLPIETVVNKTIDKPDIDFIERTSRAALLEQNRARAADQTDGTGAEGSENKKGLTDEEKAKIKEEKGWSDEIVDAINSMEEYEIYKDLKEEEINGKKCLIREIDMDQKDEDGITNAERMKRGLAPLTKDGKSVELHHIGQKSDGPLAELTPDEHRGKGNDTVLHDKGKESEIDRPAFDRERNEHWKTRADSA